MKFLTNESNKSSITAILVTLFLSTIGVSAFTFSFPLLAKQQAIAGIMVGSAFSGYFLAKSILAPVAGILSDKIGTKPLLLLAAFIGTLLPFYYFFAPAQLSIYLIQFGMGLVSGIIKPLGMAVIGAEAEEESGVLFGWYNLIFNLALMGGPIAGGLLFLQGNIVPVLYFLSFCMSVSFFSMLMLLDKKHGAGIKSSIVGDKQKDKPRNLPLLLLAVVGRTAGTAVLISFYPILLADTLGHGYVTIAIIFAIPMVTTCLLLPIGGRFSKRTNKVTLTFLGMLLSGAGLMAISMADSISLFIAAGAVIGLGAGISLPPSMALAVGDAEQKGRATGIFHLAANLGFVIGPVAAGILVQQSGGLGGAFLALGATTMFFCMPLGFSRFKDQDRGKEERALQGICVALVCAALVVTSLARSKVKPERTGDYFHFTNLAMGTIVRLNLVTEDEKRAEAAAQKAFGRMIELQEDLDHRYKDGSVGKVNFSAGVNPETVSDVAYGVIERALEFSEKAKGVFDITIGAITIVPEYFRDRVPEDKKSLVDYRRVSLDKDQQTVFLEKEHMAIDLGGVAKGTIIDEAARLLKEEGIDTALVEGGGDFYCFGEREWKTGIQHPRQQGLLGVIAVKNKAVCGSGDYQQFVLENVDGEEVRKHHIIDIEKSDSARESIGVTTIADNAELADALATTLFIMGPEKGTQFLREHYPEASAMWVLPTMEIVKTDNFPPFISLEQ